MKKASSLITTIIIAALAFAMIFGVNELLTSIEENEGGTSEYASVYPSGTDFQEASIEVPSDLSSTINSIQEVSTDGSQVGYVFDVTNDGYGGDFNYRVGISNDGLVQGFETLSHSETEGFGAAMTGQEFVDGLVGTNLSTGNVSYGQGNKENGEIVAISGATITTSAVTESLADVTNTLATVNDQVSSVVKEVPYYAEKWQELFKNDLSIFTFEEFQDDEFYDGEGITRVIRVKNDQGEVDSYLVQFTASGFGGDIDVIARLTPEYRTYGMVFGAHSESPNYGAYIDDPAYKEFLKGLNLDKNLLTKAIKLRTQPKQEKDILLISGATVTSNAMKRALDSVINDLEDFNGIREDDSKYVTFDLQAALSDSQGSGINHAEYFEGITETNQVASNVNDHVTAISSAIADGSEVGQIIDISTEGFAGPIEFGLLVSPEGVVEDFVVYNHGETPGYGAGIEEDSYKTSIVGKSLSENTDMQAAGVEAVSGATITSTAMYEALNSAASAYQAQ